MVTTTFSEFKKDDQKLRYWHLSKVSLIGVCVPYCARDYLSLSDLDHSKIKNAKVELRSEKENRFKMMGKLR